MQDRWLQAQLLPRVQSELRQPVGFSTLQHREVPVGPTLSLTLHPVWQPMAQRLAECFTGNLSGAECDGVVPDSEPWRRQYLDASAQSTDTAHRRVRAGALGLVMLDVDTGRIVALAGAISPCSLQQLRQEATRNTEGKIPALRPGLPCAQLPDRRSSWLAQQHPALWQVPPGSALKPLAYGAGIDAHAIPRADAGSESRWTTILARSEERLPVQRVAMASGDQYLSLLRAPAFGGVGHDLLWGTAANGTGTVNGSGHTRWWQPGQSGAQGLRAVAMTLDQAERMRAEKESGVNIDARYGPRVMEEFLAARRLADASVGGADIRTNALSLATLWQGLDRRARGKGTAPAPHLIEWATLPQTHTVGAQMGTRFDQRSLDMLSPDAAQRTLVVTAGVTSAQWGGTAQGSCRVAMGQCPASGVAGLSGKTGSADFLMHEDSPWVKSGQHWPSKLFAAVFTGADGRRYAIAAMGLRVRQEGTDTLELSSSSPAEAALLMVRKVQARLEPSD
jgi:hypothetical protein